MCGETECINEDPEDVADLEEGFNILPWMNTQQ